MIPLICMFNQTSPENLATLKAAKWEKCEHGFITKNMNISQFYNITNIHIPTLYAMFDKTRAKTGYSTGNIHFEHYLTYTKHRDGFILRAVVLKNNRKIINMKTTGTLWDYLELFQK